MARREDDGNYMGREGGRVGRREGGREKDQPGASVFCV